MVDTASKPELGAVEKLLLALDVGLPGALYRMLLGAATVPAGRWLLGPGLSLAGLSLVFIGILVALRVGTAVARKAVPASPRLKEAWSVRRRMAKYFDSYQWRKLLWFGAGMALYAALAPHEARDALALASFCLVAGVAGALRWRAIATNPRYPKPAPRKIK